MTGIENLKAAITLPLTLIKSYRLANEDQKINWQDVGHMTEPAMALFPALQSIPKLPGEFSDLDDTEAKELKEWVAREFDIDDDKLEETVEKAFGLALDLGRFITDVSEKKAS